MAKLNIQLCPETGVCSVIKEGGEKVDMMPDEVMETRKASGNTEAIRRIIAGIDADFAQALTQDEIQELSQGLG